MGQARRRDPRRPLFRLDDRHVWMYVVYLVPSCVVIIAQRTECPSVNMDALPFPSTFPAKISASGDVEMINIDM